MYDYREPIWGAGSLQINALWVRDIVISKLFPVGFFVVSPVKLTYPKCPFQIPRNPSMLSRYKS